MDSQEAANAERAAWKAWKKKELAAREAWKAWEAASAVREALIDARLAAEARLAARLAAEAEAETTRGE